MIIVIIIIINICIILLTITFCCPYYIVQSHERNSHVKEMRRTSNFKSDNFIFN